MSSPLFITAMYMAFIAFLATAIYIYGSHITEIKLGLGGDSNAPALITYCILGAALFLFIAIITQINT